MTKPAIRSFTAFTAGLLACGVFAGEQVQFKGSTSVELPKPKRSIGDSRNLNTEPERPNLEGGFVAPPAIETSPSSDRKLREALDKKKNWIFMDPNEQHFDSKTEEFMKGEKGTGLYDNPWMTSKEEKTLVQKYIERKDQKDGPRKENENNSERSTDKEELRRDREELDLKNDPAFLPGGKSQFDTPLFKAGVSDPFASSSIEKKSDGQKLFDSPFVPKASAAASVLDKEEIKQKQIAHDKEFDQILQTRLGSGTSLGKIDSLAPAADIGRLDFGGSASRASAQSLNLGRPAPSSANTVTFTDGGSSSFGARPSFDSRGIGEGFGGTPAKIAPAFSSPAPQAPTVAGPGFSPAPFSLPFPQRKF